MSIGKRLKAVRESLPDKPSQEQFGAKIGLSRDQVNNLERDRAAFPKTVSMLLQTVYGVNPDWLDSGNGSMFQTIEDSDFLVINHAVKSGSKTKVRLLRIIADMPDSLLDEMFNYLTSQKK